MLIEILIVLEIVAFAFLALGIIPFKGKEADENIPLLNKILFVTVGAIMFFSLAITAVQYDYTYCYINQTTADYVLNATTSTATCDSYEVSNQGLAYLNWGMGLVSIVLMAIIILFASLSNKILGRGGGENPNL